MDERMYSGVGKQFEMMVENSQRAWTGNFVRQKLFAAKKSRGRKPVDQEEKGKSRLMYNDQTEKFPFGIGIKST